MSQTNESPKVFRAGQDLPSLVAFPRANRS